MPTLSDIDKQIAELEAQKQKLIKKEKEDALAKVKTALAELNALGFNYSLSEGTISTRTTRTRRPGVRDEVLTLIKKTPTGLTRADVLEKMGAKGDTRAEQSISNALANLKKSGSLNLTDGTYTAV